MSMGLTGITIEELAEILFESHQTALVTPPFRNVFTIQANLVMAALDGHVTKNPHIDIKKFGKPETKNIRDDHDFPPVISTTHPGERI